MGRKMSIGEKGENSIDEKKKKLDKPISERKFRIDEGKKFEEDKLRLVEMYEDINNCEELDTSTKINLMKHIKQSLTALRDAYNEQIVEKINEANEEIDELQKEIAQIINQHRNAESSLRQKQFISLDKNSQMQAQKEAIENIQNDRKAYENVEKSVDNDNREASRQVQSMNTNMGGGL